MTDPQSTYDAGRVLELSTDDVLTPEANRIVTLETVPDLLASMQAEGQLVPALVCPHPDLPGKWLCLGGNRRLFCCRVLCLKLKAVAVEGPVTEERQVKLRLTENVIRRNMSLLEIAEGLQRYMQLGDGWLRAVLAPDAAPGGPVWPGVGLRRRLRSTRRRAGGGRPPLS